MKPFEARGSNVPDHTDDFDKAVRLCRDSEPLANGFAPDGPTATAAILYEVAPDGKTLTSRSAGMLEQVIVYDREQ